MEALKCNTAKLYEIWKSRKARKRVRLGSQNHPGHGLIACARQNGGVAGYRGRREDIISTSLQHPPFNPSFLIF